MPAVYRIERSATVVKMDEAASAMSSVGRAGES